jgi:glycosyltransferase involved in cell wall biosynthesis
MLQATEPGSAKSERKLWVLFARQLNIGGSQRQLSELAIGLAKKGREVVFLTFYSGGLLEDELRSAGVTVVSLEKRSRWDLFGPASRLISISKKLQPGVIVSFFENTNLATLLMKCASPSSIVLWGIRRAAPDVKRTDFIHRAVSKLEAMLSYFANKVVCNSPAAAEYAESRGISRGKIQLISNGVDLERFRIDTSGRESFRRNWRVDSLPLIGLVGRYDPVKNHKLFIEAAAAAKRAGLHYCYVFIGEGPASYIEELKECACRAGEEITFQGPLEMTSAVYGSLDILTICSVNESSPNVLFEAMASGVKCVVRDIGNCKEIIGYTGTVFSGGAQELVGAWRSALASQINPEQIRARVESEYSRDKMVSQMIDLACKSSSHRD